MPVRAIVQFGCADVSDSTTATGVAYAYTRIVSLPALSLAIIDAEDPVRVGGDVTYRIALRNEGNDADTTVQVTAELPQEMEFVDASGSTKAQSEGKTIEFEPIEKLDPGDTRNWTVVARPTTRGTDNAVWVGLILISLALLPILLL